MKINLFFGFVLCLNQMILGQQKTESNLFSQMYSQYVRTPVFLTEIPLENFTESSLYYHQNKGDLRLGQQNREEILFGITSKGMYKHNKLLFWGDIQVERQYEKDKKWNLSYADVSPEGIMPDPHYYAVSKGSEWNNQRYKLLGGVLIPIVEQKWDLALSSDYELSQRFRTEYDPRPNVKHNKLVFNISSGVSISNEHKIAIGGNYGYGKVQNGVNYSEELVHSPANYDRYLRWQVGYGTPQNARLHNAKRNHTYHSIWLGYHYKMNKGYLYAYGQYGQQNTDTYRTSGEIVDKEEDMIGVYTIGTFSGLISYLRYFSKSNILYVSAENFHTSGFNYLIAQAGKNYVSAVDKFQLKASSLNMKDDLIHSDVGLSIGYLSAYQKDVLSKTLSKHSHLNVEAYFKKEYPLKQMSVFPQVSFVYHQKLHNNLVNNNTNYHKDILDTDYASKHIRLFYDEVVYPDYHHFGKNRYEFHFGAALKKPLKDNRFVLIGVSTTYKTTFEAQKDNRYHLFLKLAAHY